MCFAIVLKNSNYVVRIFQAANEAGAKDVFKKFLKVGVKDDCHENFLLKPFVYKSVRESRGDNE